MNTLKEMRDLSNEFKPSDIFPECYRKLDLACIQLKSLRESLPVNLTEKYRDSEDLETFDIQLEFILFKMETSLKHISALEQFYCNSPSTS